MTLPITVDLPLRGQYDDKEGIDGYIKDLVFELQTMYERIAENVNGHIRSYADTQLNWVPKLNSATSGTIIYTEQIGWIIRQGIFTHIFFDISWSSIGTSTGTLYLELPYKVITTAGKPFVSALQTSVINFAPFSSLFVSAISNTYNGEIYKSGANLVTETLKIETAPSGRIVGTLFYIGVEDE